MKRAVCVLLSNPEGKILAVSRKHDTTAFGLPGGKVDLYESDEYAAVREVREETGLELDIDSLREVYRGPCLRTTPDGEDYDVVTYLGNWSGELHTDEDGIVKWVEPHVLVQPGQPFRWYNWEVLRRLGVTP